ncbi:16S rRNA (uracil(1498)-N(3))-methyltransferase [candidate division KSB1 bacterium]|nr:16S rRNA (uracil(1498)-N(3))-methyltransferase [candidate division KSB1 bacterium]
MEILTREWGEFVYAPPEARTGDLVRLPTAEEHHLYDVLRFKVGAKARVTDGAGCVYDCEVQSDRTLRILQEHREFGEATMRLTLVMAVLKGDTNKAVVDNATQLGAVRIRFFHGARSEGRMDESKVDKLRRVALVAVKQCGRARLPSIECCRDLTAALGRSDEGAARYIAHPLSNSPGGSPGGAMNVEILVGPEGGFTDSEAQAAMDAGYEPLDLGVRRLRAECAAAAAITTLVQATRP